jgi:hypothetical protein
MDRKTARLTVKITSQENAGQHPHQPTHYVSSIGNGQTLTEPPAARNRANRGRLPDMAGFPSSTNFS